MDEQTHVAVKSAPYWRSPVEGDLVLLRRAVLGMERSRKLEPRWGVPYLLTKVHNNGRSAVMDEFQTKKEIGRYYMDTLKLFVQQENHERRGGGWEDTRKIALAAKPVRKKAPLEADFTHDDANPRTRGVAPGDDIHYRQEFASGRPQSQHPPPNEDHEYWSRRKLGPHELVADPPLY